MILDTKAAKIVLSMIAFCLAVLAVFVGVTGWGGSTPTAATAPHPTLKPALLPEVTSEPLIGPTLMPTPESIRQPTPTPEVELEPALPPLAESTPAPTPVPTPQATPVREEKPVAEPAPAPKEASVDEPKLTPTPEESPLDEPEPTPTSEESPVDEAVPVLPSEGVYINPPSQKVKPGQEISINVEAKLVDCGISGSEIELEFDPTVFQVTDLISGDLLGASPLIGTEEKDNEAGTVRYALARRGPTQITNSTGVLAKIKFRGRDSAGSGSHNLTLAEVKLTNEKFEDITGFEIQSGSVEVVQ